MMSGAAKIGALALVTSALDHCGPTHTEVGEVVLVAWPVVMLVGIAVQMPILLLWRRHYRELKTPWPHMVASFAVAVSLALGVIVNRDSHGYAPWLGIALVAFGTSYLAFLLLATRIWLAFDRKMPQLGAHLVAIAVQIVPAMLLAAGLWPDERPDPTGLFILPGYFGVVPGGLFVGFLVEAWLRNRHKPLRT
jgi:hypothetical protein